jgi:hypothetical protein
MVNLYLLLESTILTISRAIEVFLDIVCEYEVYRIYEFLKIRSYFYPTRIYYTNRTIG